MFWTPFSAVVGLVIITTETNWLNIFLVLFLTSIFCLMSSWIIFYLFRSKYKINLSDSSVLENKNVPMDNNLDISGKKKLIELCVAITILVILLMVLDQLLSYGLVMIVTLVCLPTVMVWSLLLKKTKKCFKEIYYHFSYFVPNMTENFSIFLSAGFFVNVLRYTGYDVLINEQLIFIKELIGMSLFLIFLPMIIIIFSFLGVHPMVLIALIAESLHPIKLGIDSEELALSLIFGGVMTYMIGPFSGTLGLMSTIMKTTAFRIISWNLIGVSVFFLITLCTIIIYRML